MSTKSRSNWNLPLCLKTCANRGKACKVCVQFSHYVKALDTTGGR